jgi:hypothetical protein
MKILHNDWPYGIQRNIVHLIVWMKFEIEDDPTTTELPVATREQIQDYVKRVFCVHLEPENVLWFRNSNSLKSVHALEHIHVLLNNPDPKFVRDITDNDIPLSGRPLELER